MREKVRLQLDMLTVESFPTLRDPATLRGTVRGRESENQTGYTESSCDPQNCGCVTVQTCDLTICGPQTPVGPC
ncbi:MAG: hypothetical protein JO306_10995 [Gemmatimonadetes bacterium]|nr:hypothetical protein [Gemmatimonadota bacterium]